MIIIGITGGSGCGKTTVSNILSNNGVDVVDCDLVARKIVEPNEPALNEINSYFGSEYIKEDGTLDRIKLASLDFSDSEKLLKLNEITHKYVEEYIDLYIKNSKAEIVGLDAAALIESGIYKKCDYLISVLADKKTRAKRIIKRDMLSKEEATSRINAQKNDTFYIEKSDYIVYNNDNIDSVNNKVREILDEIRSKIWKKEFYC